MCYLVTIGTREEARAGIEVPLGDDRLLAVWPSSNPIAAVCVFSAGPPVRGDVRRSRDLIRPSLEQQRARLRTRYERKRWSEAKIARAQADWARLPVHTRRHTRSFARCCERLRH